MSNNAFSELFKANPFAQSSTQSNQGAPLFGQNTNSLFGANNNNTQTSSLFGTNNINYSINNLFQNTSNNFGDNLFGFKPAETKNEDKKEEKKEEKKLDFLATSNPFSNNGPLFGSKNENNEKKEEKKEEKINFLSTNNPFNSNASLFGSKNEKKEKKEENSGSLFGLTNQGNTGFNFNSGFSFNNSMNNNNGENKISSLFTSNNNTNTNNSTHTNKNNDNDNETKKEKDKNTNQTGGILFGFNNKGNNENEKKSEGLFNMKNDEDKGNTNTSSNFGLFGNGNNNISLFGNDNSQKTGNSTFDNTFNFNSKKNEEKKPSFGFGFVQDKKEENKVLFGADQNNNKDNNASLFSAPKKEENKEPKLNFSNGNNSNFFTNFQPNKEEKKENEKENNMTLFNNSNYNPFQKNSNNESNSIIFNEKKEDENVFNKDKDKDKEESTKKNFFININNANYNILANMGESENNIINTNSKDNKNNNEVSSNEEKIEINDDNDNDNINDDDMDMEEEIKDETSSTRSDKINNLWNSDYEEIIDDDTDLNKKIDYKNVEVKSKNIPHNLNDLNLLIIPELSEYYFIKSNPENYNFYSDSNIKDKTSMEISNQIIKILHDKINTLNDEEDEEKKNELINITTIYTYFDAFILHRNDIVYLMKLRDELLYKFYIPNEALKDIENKNKEKNNINNKDIVESIINNLNNIYMHLSLLDISKAYQKVSELNRIYKDVLNIKKGKGNPLDEYVMVFNELFMNIEKIINIYNDIYKLKDNFNSKLIVQTFNMNSIFQEVKETIFNLQKDIMYKNSSNKIKKLFQECQRICGMFSGEMNFIINEYNKNNIHLIILGNIFYRFHLHDFIQGLQQCLLDYRKRNDIEKDLVNKIIIKIINNCDSNQIEIVQELKGNYLFLLRYHMIEILSQNEFLYQIENQEKYLKQETYLFFQMLRDSKIPFKYFLNYFLFCPNYEIFIVDSIQKVNALPDEPSEEMRDEGYRRALDYALIYISYKFNNIDNVEDLIDDIDEIKSEINEKIKNEYSNDILYKINKLCLNKFIEKNLYKYSICCYIDNFNLDTKDYNKLLINQKRNELCAYNNLNYDYPKQFDKAIINFYLDTNELFNMNKFKEMYENNDNQILEKYNEYQELLNIILTKKENKEIDNNVLFIIKYIKFLLDVIKYNIHIIERKGKTNINIVSCTKNFFDNCFPLPKCPTFLWYHVLMTIKKVIDDNITMFNNDTFINDNNICEQLVLWDKKLINNLIKIENIKNNKNKINYDDAHNMYENAVMFMNDITQGLYFNQNLFYISENNNNNNGFK